VTDNPALYEKRNERVLKSWVEGKSRWGDAEVLRVQGKSVLPPVAHVAGAPVRVTRAKVNAVELMSIVNAADHGLRADGGVGGLSLSERINYGTQAIRDVFTNWITGDHEVRILYEKRNENVMNAAAVGKSRWGQSEVERIRDLQRLESGDSFLNRESDDGMRLERKVLAGGWWEDAGKAT
jgi:hypothetical protein